MRKTHWLGVVGVLFVIAGMSLLFQSRVLAQDAETTPEPYTGMSAPIEGEPPYLADIYNEWVGSAHADTTAEAFNHWNSEGAVSASCARCHSTPGFIDYVGGDGSEAFSVEADAPIGTVITCDACHNSAAMQLTSVTFPSGVTIDNVGSGVQCMQCHQGRESTDSVNAAIASKSGLEPNSNEVSADLSFVNVHYRAAAATLFGGEARGGYQYDGKYYQQRNLHAEGLNTCTSCHDQHSLEVKVDLCESCHDDVRSVEDLPYIRMNGSLVDYNGNGDTLEGIGEEISGLQEMEMEAIQAYATEVSGTDIAYSADSYPYWFVDTNSNGEVDEDEATRDNGYKAFTPVLLEATYNYQFVVKDPGAFAHNPKYVIELLYNSIESLNTGLSDPIDLSEAHRDDVGHFNITAEPFRHWDEEGEVSASCSKCHSATGLPFYLENGVTIAQPVSQSLTCSTCHDVANNFETHPVDEVTFPSGMTVSFGEGDAANLCISCHQGRKSTVSVNAAIAKSGAGDNDVSDALSFRNVHYFAAGATLFGTEVKGAYEFDGQEYNGRNMHDGEDYTTCTDCHETHTGAVKIDACSDCHDVRDAEDLQYIRNDEDEAIDYNGNGDVDEGIAQEIASFQDALYTAIQTYAADTAGAPIIYSANSYPYFFADTNGNGELDPDEANGGNSYKSWTPNLLRAAYNYQYSVKDPGVFAHNPDYIMQVLYDSIEAVGGDVSTFTRPPVEPSGAQ